MSRRCTAHDGDSARSRLSSAVMWTRLVSCAMFAGCSLPQLSAIGDGSAARCDPMAPFGTPTAVTALNWSADPNINDEDAYILADGLTVWFSSDRSVAFRAYQASRPSVDSVAFNTPTQLSGNTQPVERPIALDGGLTMLGATQSGGQFFIGIAQRTSLKDLFGALDTMGVMKNVNLTPGNGDTLEPYSSPDGNVLYFASDREGGGVLHLYRSSRSGSSFDFGMPEPVVIAGLDSTITEQSFPVVSPDQLTLYFAAKAGNRTAVYRATSSGMGVFGGATLQHLDVPAQASSNTKPSWVSADDCVLYITTDDGQDGQREIYVATRSS